IAIRAASIWRAVKRQRSVAWSPKSPNATELPRTALPFMRPFCCLRCLTFLGWSIVLSRDLVLHAVGERALARLALCDVALEDPALDADHAVGGTRLRQPEVDVGAQRMERHASLEVALAAPHLGAAQASRGLEPYPFGAELHGGGERLLHGAPEGHAPLELQRDVLRDELRVELGLPDLPDVHEDLAVGEARELLAQRLHLGTALADQDPGARGVDVEHHLVGGPVDHDLGDAGVVQLLLDEAPDLMVFLDLVGVAPLREPVGLPAVEGPEPEPVGMHLLAHQRS